jgi:GTPase SAR1 family protein
MNKPAAIIALEKEIGVTLKEVEFKTLKSELDESEIKFDIDETIPNFSEKYSYMLDEKGNVVGSYMLDEKGNVVGLNLNEYRLVSIPNLENFRYLRTLFLSSNQLTKIENLSELEQLQMLKLYSNRLTKIENLSELKQLQWLDLHNNQLSKIENLSELKQLQSLELSYNQLSKIENLSELKQLQWLGLTSTQLTKIENLSELKQLKGLDLSHNQLTKIESLSELTQLELLYLSDNQLTDEENIESNTIVALPNLKDLHLYNNPLHLPDKSLLGKIWWDNCPPALRNYSEELHLYNKPLPLPYKSLLGYYQWTNCLPELRAYFEAKRKSGEVELCEAKIILLGNGGAGKTSLRKRWVEKLAALPKLDSTDKFEIAIGEFSLEKEQIETIENEAIAINEIPAQAQEQANEQPSRHQLTARIWDFSGQQIDHQIHHFFLTADAYYILLHDNRREGTNFGYWFHLIRLMCEKAKTRICAQQPVSVILNNNTIQNANAKAEFNEDSFAGIFPELAINSYNTDLQKSSYADLYENLFFPLQERILSLLGGKKSYPKSWIQVREELAKEKSPYISKREYNKICEKFGIDKSEGQSVLLAYLNRIGELIHFPAHKINQTIFLDPEWVANALYTALRSKKISEGNGFFTKKTLFSIWEKADITADDAEHLLSLMGDDGFLICYPVNEQKELYGYPQKLRSEDKIYSPTKYAEHKEDKNVLFAEIEQEKANLPIALRIQLDLNEYANLSELLKQVFKDAFSRLAVSFYKQFKINEFGQELVWNTGMILERNNDKAFLDLRNTNQLWIHSNSAFYLNEIVNKWKEIRANYFAQILKDSIVKMEIPCTCEKYIENPCFIKYEKVIEQYKKGKKIRCKREDDEQDDQDAAMFLNRWSLTARDREILLNLEGKFQKLHNTIEQHYEAISDKLVDNKEVLGEHHAYVKEFFETLAEEMVKNEVKAKAKVEIEEGFARLSEIQQYSFFDKYVEDSALPPKLKEVYRSAKNNGLPWLRKEIGIGAVIDIGKGNIVEMVKAIF